MVKQRARGSNKKPKSRPAKPDELLQFDPAIFASDLQRVVLSAVLAPLYRFTRRQQMRKLHPASDDKMDAELLTTQAKLRIQQSIEAFCLQELPGLLAYILDSAREGNAWACKLILELTGIADKLRLVADPSQRDIQEAEALSEMEKSLLASLRQLVTDKDKEEAQPDAASR